MYEQRAGDRCDGCATFWNPDSFEAVGVDRIQLAEHGLKDNVALLVMLRARGGSGSGSGGSAGETGAEGGGVAQGDEQARQEGACGSGRGGEAGISVQAAAQGGKRRSGGEQQDEAVGRRRSRGLSLKDRFTQGGGSRPEDEEPPAMPPLSSAAAAAAEAAAGGQEMTDKVPLLLVANTHVHFNPRRGDVKLGQLRVILDRCGLASAVCKGVWEMCEKTGDRLGMCSPSPPIVTAFLSQVGVLDVVPKAPPPMNVCCSWQLCRPLCSPAMAPSSPLTYMPCAILLLQDMARCNIWRCLWARPCFPLASLRLPLHPLTPPHRPASPPLPAECGRVQPPALPLG